MKFFNTVIVRTSFEGFHQYKKAPKEVSFLRKPHRHIFQVEVEMQVFHNDRELEFIMVKREIDKFLKRSFDINMSCEQYAGLIIHFLLEKYGERQIYCSVFEDGENGGKVYYSNDY